MELPSKVLHKKFLRVPDTNKVVESDEEWIKCGKWNLINRSGDAAWLDRAWVALQSLVKDGYLLMLKASTAANKLGDGVIICYTRPDKEVIRRAAEEIRKRVDYRHSMYYKDNGLTENGVSLLLLGTRNFTLYMHTAGGRFYRRSDCQLWKLDEDNQVDNPLAFNIDEVLNFCNLDVNELPSCALKLVPKLDLISKNTKGIIPKGCAYFHTHCSLKREGSGLSEADRLWIVAKKLLQDDVVERIECMKIKPAANARKGALPLIAKIQIYASRSKNISSLVQTICKLTNFTEFFYDGMCRYSFDGELEYVESNMNVQ